MLICIAAACACAQETEEQPKLLGFVTRVATTSDFDVNGVRITCGPETFSMEPGSQEYVSGCPADRPVLGESVRVFGRFIKGQNTLAATKLDFKAPELKDVSGSAVIDAAPDRRPLGAPAGSLMIRADGYRILIERATQTTWMGPIHSLGDITANTWVEYKAKARSDGVLVADSATFFPNTLMPGEEKAREKVQYDPTAAAVNGRQNALEAGIVGVDFHRIPPWTDAAMQDRVKAIGKSLIPSWQTGLSATDPAKIDFQFEAVNGNWGPYVISLPDGVVLVPHQAVERMQNDAQLAALLADGIATVLEKQQYRMRNMLRAMTIGGVASEAATFIPVVNLAAYAGLVAFGAGGASIQVKEMSQSTRVSLDLLQDAGYDLGQAPLAWWLLGARKPKPFEDLPTPLQTVVAYHMLSTVWRATTQTETPAPGSVPATASR